MECANNVIIIPLNQFKLTRNCPLVDVAYLDGWKLDWLYNPHAAVLVVGEGNPARVVHGHVVQCDWVEDSGSKLEVCI